MKIKKIKALFSTSLRTAVKSTTPKPVVKKSTGANNKVLKDAEKKRVIEKTVTSKKITAAKGRIILPQSAKKTVVKKSVSKTSKKTAKKTPTDSVRLVVASDSESFWVTDGQVLNSVVALEEALRTMKKSVYDYHALTDGNHFADWVESVLADADLATALRPVKTAKAAALLITQHLKTMSR